MSDFRACKTCGRYGWVSSHVCPPMFECRLPDYGTEWFPVYGDDPEDAATTAAASYDGNGEYEVVRNGSAVVEVRRDDQAWTFDVEAESRPHYTAYERSPSSGEG